MITGAEKKIVFLSVINALVAAAQASTNVNLYYSFEQDIEEMVITSLKDAQGIDTSGVLYKKLQSHFAQGSQTTVIAGTDIATNPKNLKEMLDEIKADWFALVTDEMEASAMPAIAAEAAAREKLYIATPKTDTTIEDIETLMQAVTLGNFVCIPSKNDETSDARLAGYFIPKSAGVYQWANTIVNGGVDGGFSGAEQSRLKAANCCYMARMKGNIALAEGIGADGMPVDFTHFSYTLKFRLEEDLTADMLQSPKSSFADTSDKKAVIQKRTGTYEEAFKLGDGRQIAGPLIPGRTVITFPPLDEIPNNDIANGVLNGVKVAAVYNYGYKELNLELFFVAPN